MKVISAILKIDEESLKKLGAVVESEVIWSERDDDHFVEPVIEVGEFSTEVRWVVHHADFENDDPPMFATLEAAIDHVNELE